MIFCKKNEVETKPKYEQTEARLIKKHNSFLSDQNKIFHHQSHEKSYIP